MINRRQDDRRTARAGFSLLEVVLALAILTGAIAVLGELVRLGTRNAAVARDLTAAVLHAESKMAELTSGMTPPEAVQMATMETDERWLYSIDVSQADDGILAVYVTVTQNLPSGRPMEYTLTRWIVDPDFVLAMEEVAAEAEAAAAETEATE